MTYNTDDCSSGLHEYCNICECPCHTKYLNCSSCGKQVSSGYVPRYVPEMPTPEGNIIVRAWIECPECIQKRHRPDNPLQTELLDLITMMPDQQTQDIIDYIMDLRRIRSDRDGNKSKSN